MRRYWGTLLMGAVLAAPGYMRADDEHHEREERREAHRLQRYYDPTARDWHEWNEEEQRAYRHWWLEERREQQLREFNRLRDRDRLEYWRWRHLHEGERFPDVR